MNTVEQIGFETGIPLMTQVAAHPVHLEHLALKGAKVVVDAISVAGNPSYPDALRGSIVADKGAFVSFESITPTSAVLHMSALGVSTKKVAQSGEGFYYALPGDMTAEEARRLASQL